MQAICTTGLENFTVALGIGKWITSVTMTLFYVLLYYVWRERYEIKGAEESDYCSISVCRNSYCIMHDAAE